MGGCLLDRVVNPRRRQLVCTRDAVGGGYCEEDGFDAPRETRLIEGEVLQRKGTGLRKRRQMGGQGVQEALKAARVVASQEDGQRGERGVAWSADQVRRVL
uniref:Uncharacterized protein n=1 Tax=Melanopsichium pennsylvanicum 4 TaxID=1398559 RepID=A0A077R433_9BASI|nr:uncharacterized protein BN887_06030 [Melanopsichium pennsylvanicum 4]